MLWDGLSIDVDTMWGYALYKFYQYVVMLTVLLAYLSIFILKHHQTSAAHESEESRSDRAGSAESTTDNTTTKSVFSMTKNARNGVNGQVSSYQLVTLTNL